MGSGALEPRTPHSEAVPGSQDTKSWHMPEDPCMWFSLRLHANLTSQVWQERVEA